MEHSRDIEEEPLIQRLEGAEEGPGSSIKITEPSPSDRKDSQKEKEKRYMCGLMVKRDTTWLNIAVMPLLPFVSGTINFYSTTFLPLLLQHDDYFAIQESELGKATAVVIIWAALLPLILTPFLTYLFETVGRRIPVSYALLSSNVLFWVMPKVAPNFTLLCVIRAFIGLNNTILIGAPLISDYIKQESRGKAVALSALFLGLSQVFATQFLIPFTAKMTYDESFGYTALILLTLTIPAIFMIREPSPKRDNIQQQHGAEAGVTFTQTIRQVSHELFTRVCFDPKWIFIFLGISQAHLLGYLYSSYLILWLNSFVQTGQIEDDKAVEAVYSRITLVALPVSLLMVFASGYLADVIKPVYLIVPGFFGRSVTTYMFKMIDEPKSTFTFIIVTSLIAFSIMQVVSLESLLMKNLPRDARGALTVLVTFFMGLASLLFNVVGGPFFDYLGPASPYMVVSVFDMALCFFALFLGVMGSLDWPTEEDNDVDQKSRREKLDAIESAIQTGGLEVN